MKRQKFYQSGKFRLFALLLTLIVAASIGVFAWSTQAQPQLSETNDTNQTNDTTPTQKTLIQCWNGGLVDTIEQCPDFESKIAEMITASQNTSKQVTSTIPPTPKINTAQVIEQSLNKVVKIYVGTKSFYSNEGISGSGFFVSEDGYIITNAHVVQPLYDFNSMWDSSCSPTSYFQSCTGYKVVLKNGDEYIGGTDVKIVAINSHYDIALLKITQSDTFKYFDFGDSSLITLGTPVYALGSPQGLDFSASKGVIGGKNRKVVYDDVDKYLQTDAAINGGNSGGPLIDEQGLVIGLNTYKMVGEGIEGIGFAMESNIIKDFYEISKKIKAEISPIVCDTDDLGNLECSRQMVKPRKPIVILSELQFSEFDILPNSGFSGFSVQVKNKGNETLNLCYEITIIRNGFDKNTQVLEHQTTIKPNYNVKEQMPIYVEVTDDMSGDWYIEVNVVDCIDNSKVFATNYARYYTYYTYR